jgi:hypothetical protein
LVTIRIVRRWAVVAAGVALLCGLPVIASALPVSVPQLTAGQLRARTWPRRTSPTQGTRRVTAGGTPLVIAGGAAAEISAPLLNAVIVRPPGFFVTFLLAGTVSTQLLEQAATELAELVTLS